MRISNDTAKDSGKVEACIVAWPMESQFAVRMSVNTVMMQLQGKISANASESTCNGFGRDKHACGGPLRAPIILRLTPIVVRWDCVIVSAHSNIHPATTVDSTRNSAERRHAAQTDAYRC